MDVAAGPRQTIFVSRAGENEDVALIVAGILRDAGHDVHLQNLTFNPDAPFASEIHAALKSGARTLALLSSDYLRKPWCELEWQATIAPDPLNRAQRLVLLKVTDCAPPGILRCYPYLNLIGLLREPTANKELLRSAVLAAIDPDPARRQTPALDALFYPARPVVHEDITDTPHFTDAAGHMTAIYTALSRKTATAVTQPVATHGLGGVGKSTLARQYGWQAARDNLYAGVWWLNAEKSGAGTFDGIERGLVALRKVIYPSLPEPTEKAAAAREMMSHLADLGAEAPWLLVYDNVDDPTVAQRGRWPVPDNVRLLMTSREAVFPAGVTRLELDKWDLEPAAAYLIEASGRAAMTQAEAEAVATAVDRLPLALSFAAAFLRESVTATPASFVAGLPAYMTRKPKLTDYPDAVFAALLGNIAQAETQQSGASAVFSLAAFFAPDNIPLELFQQDAKHYPAALRPIIEDPARLDAAIDVLARLSLLKFRAEDRTFSVHRLAQHAARDALGAEQAWRAAAVAVVNAAYPGGGFKTGPQSSACCRTPARSPRSHTMTSVTPLALLLNRAFIISARIAPHNAGAEPLYKRSLSISETALGPDHPDVGTSLNNLAGLYEAQGKYDQAEPLYKRSLRIRETALGPDHPAVGTSLNNLAGLYRAQGKYDQAEPLYKRSLSIRETALGPDHPDVGTSLNNLAGLYRSPRQIRPSRAALQTLAPHPRNRAGSRPPRRRHIPQQPRRSLLRPRQIRPSRAALQTLAQHPRNRAGSRPPRCGHKPQQPRRSLRSPRQIRRKPSRSTSARSASAKRRWVQTTPMSAQPQQPRRSLSRPRQIRPSRAALQTLTQHPRNRAGSRPPSVGTSLNNLAGLYEAQGKYDQAEPLYKRSLSIRETALGPDHPDVGTSLNNLAGLYEAQGKYDQAEPLYKRSLSISETALGPDHPNTAITLTNLAVLYANMDRWGEAAPFARRAHAIFLRALGAEHPNTKSSARTLQQIEELLQR